MRRHLSFFLRLVLSVALIVIIVRVIDWHAVLPVVTKINPVLAAIGSTLTLGLIMLLATRWSLLLHAADCSLPALSALRLAWAGQFFNSFLPGSIGGDGIRGLEIIRRFPDRRLAGAGSIILDRGSALVALFAIATTSLIIDPAPLRWLASASISGRFIKAAGGVTVLGLTALLWWGVRHRAHVRPLHALRHFKLPSAGVLASSFVLSIGIHLLNFAIIFTFARSLGLALSFGQVVRMMSVVLMLLLLPITINGHGLRELLLIKYLAYYGAGNPESAVAWSLVLVVNDLVWGLPGGLWYLLSRRGDAAATAAPSVAKQPEPA